MSDPLHVFKCNLEGDIVIDSLIPANTSGAFCDLLSATHPTAGKLALKRPRGNYDDRLIARIEIEARVWALLKHPRILRFLGIQRIGEEIYFVSAFAENGSLPGFLDRRPEVDRGRLVIEIAEGLAYLHQYGIIHGDLKGNNILISGREHVLLCDFGLAKHVTSHTSTSLRGVGSIPWQSSELLQNACRRTFESDVYAFGITVYEVLSGNEPYAHHTGIVSIITGVVFTGERPSTKPQVALNGSSYLQFWEEASMCWAENLALRPRIIDVLKRLDHRRAENLVTYQQFSLEDTLVRPAKTSLTFKPDLAPGTSQGEDGADTRNTLDWAHSIRVRMNVLVNSQQPVSRLSSEIIAEIVMLESVWFDRPENNRMFQHKGRLNHWRRGELFTAFIIRCAQLRTVCRAWRDAIDSTPTLTRYILAREGENNIQYVRRYNHGSPLECFLSLAFCFTRVKLTSLLEPHRLCSLNIWAINTAIEPGPFPMLQVLRICSRDEFGKSLGCGVDPLRMAHANPGLRELVVDFPHGFQDEEKLVTPPPLRVQHSGLQKVQLTGAWPFYKSYVLRHLGLRGSAKLHVDDMNPGCLYDPDSALRNMIRSLGKMEMSGIIRGRLEITTWHQQNMVRFQWYETDHVPLDGEFSDIASCALTNSEALDMVREIAELGIVETVELSTTNKVSVRAGRGCIGAKARRRELLSCLGSIKKLRIDVCIAALFLPSLMEPFSGETDQGDQFPCPKLTQLELFGDVWKARNTQTIPRSGISKLIEIRSGISKLIEKRQSGRPSVNTPAKLRRIGIPFTLMDENHLNDPIFDGIDIYTTAYRV